MKRLLFAAAILLVLVVAAIYILIPETLKISTLNIAPVNSDAAFRVVSLPGKWPLWLPQHGETKVIDSSTYIYQKDTLALTEILHSAIRINISNTHLSTATLFSILPYSKDSAVIKWEAELPAGANPVTRLKRYFQAVGMKKDMSAIADNLQQYISKNENVYGYDFHVGTTVDTILIALQTIHPAYPTTENLYNSIEKLQAFIKTHGAVQTAPPMLNVTPLEDGKYRLMVALPINKKLNSEGPFIYRRMVPGNFLITDVTGGTASINDALEMMRVYVRDVGKTIMAIPFQYVITDRKQEPDSTKWKTRIYYPVVR